MFPYPFPVPIPSETPIDRNKLDDAASEIRALRDTVADLQRRLEKQAVLARALFTLVSAKLGLTEAELIDRFREVEAARAGALPRKCSDCGRGINLRTHRCIYCGAACAIESAFDLLELGAWSNPGAQPAGPELRVCDKQGITARPGG